MRPARLGWIVVAMAGCGGSGMPVPGADAAALPADAGTVAPQIEVGARDFEVAAPAAPDFGACPEGWVSRDEGQVATCAPFSGESPSPCPEGEIWAPSDPSCTPLGAACPGGRFAPAPAGASVVLHVEAGAPPGGDGSSVTPFATLGQALAEAPPFAVVLVAKGVYPEAVTVGAPVEIIGACPAETVITPPSSTGAVAAIHVTSTSPAVVRNVHIEDSPLPAVVADRAGVALRLEGVRVSGATCYGVGVAFGAGLDAEGLEVVGTAPCADGDFGVGVLVQDRARAVVSRAVVAQNHTSGVLAIGEGSTLRLRNAVVRHNVERALDGIGGRGLEVGVGAVAEARQCVFLENRQAGVLVAARGHVDLLEVRVQGTEPQSFGGGVLGQGLLAFEGATATVRRSVFDGNHTAGVDSAGSSSVELWDVVVRRTEPQASDGLLGTAVTAESGSELIVHRALFEANRQVSAYAEGAGSALELRDLRVVGTWNEECGDFEVACGRGVQVQHAASALLERVAIVDSWEAGIVSTDAAALDVRDLLIAEIDPHASERPRGIGAWFDSTEAVRVARMRVNGVRGLGAYFYGENLTAEVDGLSIDSIDAAELGGGTGSGFGVTQGAEVSARDVSTSSTRSMGIHVSGPGTVLTLDRAAVRDVLGFEGDTRFARGMTIHTGATVVLSRALFERNRGVALLAGGAGTDLSADQVRIRETTELACGADCTDGSAGMGLVSLNGATMSIRDFEIEESALCGVQLATEGEVDLVDGIIRRNAIGACVQTEGYPTVRLTERVRYQENGVNVDTTDLLVPTLRSDLDPEPL